jgi:hypothetical protein
MQIVLWASPPKMRAGFSFQTFFAEKSQKKELKQVYPERIRRATSNQIELRF